MQQIDSTYYTYKLFIDVERIKQMKGKARRKHSLHEKTTASFLLKPFVSSKSQNLCKNTLFVAPVLLLTCVWYYYIIILKVILDHSPGVVNTCDYLNIVVILLHSKISKTRTMHCELRCMMYDTGVLTGTHWCIHKDSVNLTLIRNTKHHFKD